MDNCEKQPIKIYGSSGLSGRVALFQDKAAEHLDKQQANPFSNCKGATHITKLDKNDPRYGRPVEGSKTEKRGKQAGQSVANEIRLLCDLIHEYGEKQDDGSTVILFGELFQMYTRISNKVVGLLVRSRKHGLLDFEGEMLFQGRDDKVPIIMTKPIQEIRDIFQKDAQQSKEDKDS